MLIRLGRLEILDWCKLVSLFLLYICDGGKSFIKFAISVKNLKNFFLTEELAK
jgi:hypothetical protein